MTPEIDDAVNTSSTLESQLSQLERQIAERALKIDESARQIDKHIDKHMFHPLCIRQLLAEAAAKINRLHAGDVPETKPWTTKPLSTVDPHPGSPRTTSDHLGPE